MELELGNAVQSVGAEGEISDGAQVGEGVDYLVRGRIGAGLELGVRVES